MTAVPPPAPGIAPAEALIVVTGLVPFLRHTSRDLGGAIVRSEQLPDTIESKIYRFINREDREPPADRPAFDFDEVAKLLEEPYGSAADGHDLDPIENTLRAFGNNHQLAMAVGAQVTRIHAYALQQLPKRRRATLDGAERLPPPRSERLRFRRCWQIAADPLSLFDGLQEFALSRGQVGCFGAMFPTTAAQLWPIAQRCFVRKKMATPKWRLPRDREMLLRVLCQQETPSLVLAKALRSVFAEEMQAQAARQQKPAKPPVTQADEGTPVQRLDAAS